MFLKDQHIFEIKENMKNIMSCPVRLVRPVRSSPFRPATSNSEHHCSSVVQLFPSPRFVRPPASKSVFENVLEKYKNLATISPKMSPNSVKK